MLYSSGQDWLAAARKRVLLFGMSGLGKTHVSNMLRAGGGWFHYSVDYRIGTRYMGEYIADNFKREAMKVPFLAELLRSDSIYVASNITFDNLAPLSTYLGKPGDTARGGLPFAEYLKRQGQHREAERAALFDTARFIDRAEDLYGYRNFVCDSGGSICEVVDPDDPADPLMMALAEAMLLVWIEGDDSHTEELIARFRKAPKPMYYRPALLSALWQDYLAAKGLSTEQEDRVDPDDFAVFAYARAIAHRQPRYRAMAQRWGVTVSAAEVAALRSPADFEALVAHALDRAAAEP